MTDLSHWIFAENFSGYDAAALILGLEPREAFEDEHRIRVVVDRMKIDYVRAVRAAGDATVCFEEESFPSSDDGYLLSEKLESLCELAQAGSMGFLEEWTFSGKATQFDNQTFGRKTLAKWLKAIGLSSVYKFERSDSNCLEGHTREESVIDPSDLPPELDAANLAYRAITNGFGDQSATPRNRLIQFLESTFPNFKVEQIRRIATVANPDKTTGRKKLEKE